MGGFLGTGKTCNNRFVCLNDYFCSPLVLLKETYCFRLFLYKYCFFFLSRWLLKKYPGNAGGIPVKEGLFDHPVGETLPKYLENQFSK